VLYPTLVDYILTSYGKPDVMRFWGTGCRLHGGNFEEDVRSDLREREEGTGIKHSVDRNSVKAYGKVRQVAGSVFG